MKGELPIDVALMDENTIRRIAAIVGEASAANAVIVELENRRSVGQTPVCYYSRSAGTYFVTDAGNN